MSCTSICIESHQNWDIEMNSEMFHVLSAHSISPHVLAPRSNEWFNVSAFILPRSSCLQMCTIVTSFFIKVPVPQTCLCNVCNRCFGTVVVSSARWDTILTFYLVSISAFSCHCKWPLPKKSLTGTLTYHHRSFGTVIDTSLHGPFHFHLNLYQDTFLLPDGPT